MSLKPPVPEFEPTYRAIHTWWRKNPLIMKKPHSGHVIFVSLWIVFVEGMVIASQCTPPFSDLLCSSEFCSETYFQAWGSLTGLKSQTRDPQLKVPPGGLVLRIFTSWKNPSTSAGFEPANLISRRARYPEITEADIKVDNSPRYFVRF